MRILINTIPTPTHVKTLKPQNLQGWLFSSQTHTAEKYLGKKGLMETSRALLHLLHRVENCERWTKTHLLPSSLKLLLKLIQLDSA
jgi:hypothetical protein